MDIRERKILGKVDIYPNPDVVWLNAKKNVVYVAGSKPGAVQVVDIRQMKVVDEVTTEEGAHTFSFDQKAQTVHAYLPKSCKVAFYEEV